MKYRTSDIHIKKEDLHLQSQVFKHILKVGFPVAIQDGCIQIAFIIITIIANSRGLNDAAIVGIVEKMITAIFIIPSTMLATVSALSAQNILCQRLRTCSYSIKICGYNYYSLWNHCCF